MQYNIPMIITTLLALFASLAALLHVFIFYLETVAWTSPLAKKVFGFTDEGAAQTKEMAANQGVYNLLLAIMSAVGVVLLVAGGGAVVATTGLALVLAGCGSMLVAALYLFFSSDKKAAAIKQGTLPAVAVVLAILMVF
jgi:putative membrane protein